MKTTQQKELTKVDYNVLVQQAINEPGTIAKCYSLFHNYSLLNTIWVARQQMSRWGTINPIKGFRAWNDLNRKVKKGEKGLAVLFPVFGYFPAKDKDGNEIIKADGKKEMIKYVKGFDEKHIHFASNQTEVIDKDKEVELKAKDLQFNYELACKELGIELVPYDMPDGNCQGWARPDDMVLAINPLAAHPSKTAVHEIAHCLMHGKDCDLPRNIREVQAESVTYIICTMLGMSEDVLSECRGYVQHWLSGNELDEKVAKQIINTANKILEAGTGKKRKGE